MELVYEYKEDFQALDDMIEAHLDTIRVRLRKFFFNTIHFICLVII